MPSSQSCARQAALVCLGKIQRNEDAGRGTENKEMQVEVEMKIILFSLLAFLLMVNLAEAPPLRGFRHLVIVLEVTNQGVNTREEWRWRDYSTPIQYPSSATLPELVIYP